MRDCTLVKAQAHDAATIATWVNSADDVLLFAGPKLSYPFTGNHLLATRTDGWDVYAMRHGTTTVGTGSIRTADNTAHLGRLLVDPSRRGQGLGRTLTELLLQQARTYEDIHRITLSVYSHNTAARHIYEQLGFRVESSVTLPDSWPSLRMALG